MLDRVGTTLRNPRVADVTWAALLCAGMCMVGAVFRPPEHAPFDALAYLLTGLICLPLVVRRQAPLLVVVVTSLAYLVFVAQGYLPGLHFWGAVLAFYSLAALRPARVTALGVVFIALVVLAAGKALFLPWPAIVAQVITFPAVAWWLGDVARQLDERNGQLTEATEELRREQQQRIERERAQERMRIARELHDVVAHHMSVISMQAGLAGYVFDTDAVGARGAVETIGRTSREALEEMRRLLDLLRVTDGPTGADESEPTPTLGQLPALVERIRAARVEVDLQMDGNVVDLPSGLQLTVYRVVQEALTNVLKHAGPCRATVVVHRTAHRVTAVITNDAGLTAPIPDDGRAVSGGYGLIGMNERARLYGGSLVAGPRADGGFVVELSVPLH